MSIHQHDTRKSSKNDIFSTQKNTPQYGIRSVRFTGTEFWDSIPTTIKESVSLICFRYKIVISTAKFPYSFHISKSSNWRFPFKYSILISAKYQLYLQAGGPLSSISFAIEGAPPLKDSHCMHTKLIPLLHINFAAVPFQ